ncbi:uncharacterized protein LOC132749526 [Ruditapes philippinarum]|uniref:uncharacterized protein LOC132749526 n=1 Tax=Ruditapes philippinarum TaxID=129788 RepID=UPI00295B1F82|nr:uncharacterized protein LOC132749526 [Ruditapes philippinarum]
MPQKNGPVRPGQDWLVDLEPVGIYENGPSHDTVPIKISTYEHMYGFSNGHPDPDVFDVSQCFAMDYHSTYLAVDITGREIDEVLKFHQKEFISEVRQTIASAAKVSVTRVASIKWEEGKFNRNTRLIVTFQLFDNKLTGLEESVYTGPSLSEAISNLQNAINSGTHIMFDVVLGTSHTARLGILEGSLYEVYTTKATVTSASTRKYGAGAMAGLGIGMLVIGALLGLLAAYIIYRRFNTEIPYKVT